MAQVTLIADPAEVHAALDAAWEPGDDAGIAMGAIGRIAEFPVTGGLRDAFWRWYDEHAEDVILKKRFLVWTIEVRVKHLRPLFEKLFGQHP
jgi:hypothetical protein